MKLFEVTTTTLIKEFLKLPSEIYKSNPNWTIQLGSDIEHAFDREKNSLYATGNAIRWVLYDDWNIPAGRIAAFYNRKPPRIYLRGKD